MGSVDFKIVTMLSTLVLIAYAALGGIRSVTNTDVLQFITFVAIIFLIAKLMFVKTGKSVLEIVSLLQKQEKFQLSSLCHSNVQLLDLLLLILWSGLPIFDPTVVHRVYMCSSPIQVKKNFLYSAFCKLIIVSFICMIGLFVFVGDPMLPVAEIWNYIIGNIPSFLKASVVICILGMAMSTADSHLHLCSVLVGHDLIECIRGSKPVSDRLQIRVAQLTSLIGGLLIMIMAMYCNDLSIAPTMIISCRYMVVVYFVAVPAPWLLAIFGFRGTACTALIGMATGVLAGLVGRKLGIPFKYLMLVTVANGLAISSHYCNI